ncbi:hypothetical protein LR48_Vigan07g160700 [Vigna angularis]|uniref:Uncharacterized protein n=1 Tax=Phaseolus angularis TaxID=3914 RepID=A0A0L9UYP0_PHAAN|nr:hypothetical protein LR48_Vigan07g160700 [Vigna angularis]
MACKYVRLGYYRFYGFQFPNLFEAQGVNVKGEHAQAIQVVGSEIGQPTLRQMGFVARGNIFLHKDEANQDEVEDIDARMVESVSEADPSTTGPSAIPSSSSLSMEEHFANLSRQTQDISMVHQTRHEELFKMHQSHYNYLTKKLEDFDIRLGNIEDRHNL